VDRTQTVNTIWRVAKAGLHYAGFALSGHAGRLVAPTSLAPPPPASRDRGPQGMVADGQRSLVGYRGPEAKGQHGPEKAA